MKKSLKACVMKKFLIVIFTLLITPNAYAEMKDCKYKLDLFKNEEIYDSLMNDDNYSYNNANGKICFIYDEYEFYRAFELKNGKIVGGIEEVKYYENQPEWAFYISNHKFFSEVLESLDQNFFYGVGADDLHLLEKYKIDVDITKYQMDGIFLKYVVKNGEGSITMYHENNTIHAYKPIKNYKFHGISKLYTLSGKLYATLEYRNSEPISGKCANKGKNGKELTKKELLDWDYGIEDINCGDL